MMRIKTKPFGEVEVDSDSIIHIDEGLIGFEKTKRYVLLDMKDEDIPFKWLQAVDNPNLAFVVIPPNYFRSDYRLEVEKDELASIGLEDTNKAISLAIVVIPEGRPEQMTANLLSPIVVNPDNKRGKQMISKNPRYGVRHYILKELQSHLTDKNKEVEDAGLG
ncbi:MAG: flagellar assembly protein FliW [bacterium]|nr:flagellar assembly protein FliW [bacterium]